MKDKLYPQPIEKEPSKESPSFRKKMEQEICPDLDRKITDALLIGNSYHTRVKVVYQDDDGVKNVTTTIWASGNKFVCLKGGLWIPFERIIEIELV